MFPSNACWFYKTDPFLSNCHWRRSRSYAAFFFLVLICLVLFPSSVWAGYSDRVAAPFDEISNAAHEIFKTYGMKKEFPNQKVFESRWIVDTIVRENTLLRGIAKKDYLRRTKYRLELKPLDFTTEVNIKTSFQFKPADAAISTPWRSLKPTAEDYLKEKDLFFALLRKIEENRKKNPL